MTNPIRCQYCGKVIFPATSGGWVANQKGNLSKCPTSPVKLHKP